LTTSSRNRTLFWGVAAAVVVVDVVTKWLAVRYLSPAHVPHPVIGDVVRLTLAYNPGAAFSMSLGPYSRYIFGAFALIALVVLWNLYRRAHPSERLLSFALGLAWGGAAGNFIDRVRSSRGVIDFIDIGVESWRFWTFNVADSAVTVGAVILAWLLAHEERRTHASTQRA
jgi:signal peptidase II